jgi:hypothetical protein
MEWLTDKVVVLNRMENYEADAWFACVLANRKILLNLMKISWNLNSFLRKESEQKHLWASCLWNWWSKSSWISNKIQDMAKNKDLLIASSHHPTTSCHSSSIDQYWMILRQFWILEVTLFLAISFFWSFPNLFRSPCFYTLSPASFSVFPPASSKEFTQFNHQNSPKFHQIFSSKLLSIPNSHRYHLFISKFFYRKRNSTPSINFNLLTFPIQQ